MDNDEKIMLGRIDGKLDGIAEHLQRQDKRLDTIDERLRVVEQKAAIAGAMSGGAMSVGVALIIEGIKSWLGRGGPGVGP
jgi:hypothetical protein